MKKSWLVIGMLACTGSLLFANTSTAKVYATVTEEDVNPVLYYTPDFTVANGVLLGTGVDIYNGTIGSGTKFNLASDGNTGAFYVYAPDYNIGESTLTFGLTVTPGTFSSATVGTSSVTPSTYYLEGSTLITTSTGSEMTESKSIDVSGSSGNKGGIILASFYLKWDGSSNELAADDYISDIDIDFTTE
ncbi:MAG: hypothetical protein LKE40_08630 [Spirochaetia bacterium]|jgi:hypothetical protein|nr:hypothetical protein [Spirochaetia bacterium]